MTHKHTLPNQSAPPREYFDVLFNRAPQPMWVYDPNTLEFLDVNEAALNQYGYDRGAFLVLQMRDLFVSGDVPNAKQAVVQSQTPWCLRTRSGQQLWVEPRSQTVSYDGRDAVLVVAVDISARQNAEQRLSVQQSYFRQLFNASNDAVLLLDAEGVVFDANAQFVRLFGYCLDDITGTRGEALIDDTAEPVRVQGNSGIERNGKRRHKDGRELDVGITGRPIMINGERVGAYLIYRDLTEKKRLLRRVRYHATHDFETQLINRHEFKRRLWQALNDPKQAPVAVAHVALNRLNLLARGAPPTVGKTLFKQVAARLSEASQSDVIAHIYADEFCVLLPNSGDEHGADVAKTLIENLATVTEDGHRLSTNVGVFVADGGKISAHEAMAVAEMACQNARDKGGHKYHLAHRDDAETAQQRRELDCLAAIHEALDEQRLVLYTQSIAPLANPQAQPKKEVLVRMIDADGAIVKPDDFIPVAERFQLMNEVDRWLVAKLFHTLDAIIKERGALTEDISVNLSGDTVGDDGLIDFIYNLFDQTVVPPARICFEITETAAIQNIAQARHFITAMRALGCTIALDDFGSGMSSFKYLRELTVDFLKIDGLFIKDLLTNAADRTMTEAISTMAHSLGITVIAEWVEHLDTLEPLREWGVGYVQGFAIDHPAPLEVAAIDD